MNKYRNIKTQYRGIKFDSMKERDYYMILEHEKKQGNIEGFTPQHKLIFTVDGKIMFRLIVDFFVIDVSGDRHYIDVKALDKKTGKFLTTPVFNLKRKLIEAQYKIKIELK